MFKGELSLDDIVGMVYKKLVSLREARVKRLMEEAKEAEKEASSSDRQNIRNTIMKK